MGSLTILPGMAKGVLLGLFFIRLVIIFDQIGEAPVTPEATRFMGELSLFPTQVATTKSGV
jgi:hypothetical protein